MSPTQVFYLDTTFPNRVFEKFDTVCLARWLLSAFFTNSTMPLIYHCAIFFDGEVTMGAWSRSLTNKDKKGVIIVLIPSFNIVLVVFVDTRPHDILHRLGAGFCPAQTCQLLTSTKTITNMYIWIKFPFPKHYLKSKQIDNNSVLNIIKPVCTNCSNTSHNDLCAVRGG